MIANFCVGTNRASAVISENRRGYFAFRALFFCGGNDPGHLVSYLAGCSLVGMAAFACFVAELRVNEARITDVIMLRWKIFSYV